MKILVLDNYDSFTYNLVNYLEMVDHTDVDVFRNDAIALEKIASYDKILLSPGPGLPSESGILLPLIKAYAATKSILGICLGHQAIGEVFGGKLVNLATVYHGVATEMKILKEDVLFGGIPNNFKAGRYHSWVVDRNNFPEELEITAEDENGYVMALRHKKFDLVGVQFHPESILTEHGVLMIRNWVEL